MSVTAAESKRKIKKIMISLIQDFLQRKTRSILTKEDLKTRKTKNSKITIKSASQWVAVSMVK